MTEDAKRLARALLLSRYSGLLADGPKRARLGLLSSFATFHADEIKRLQDEREKRIPLLFDHFGINPASPDSWEKLARALAEQHVPGFTWSLDPQSGHWGYLTGRTPLSNLAKRPKRGRGRPRKAKFNIGLLTLSPQPKALGRPQKLTIDEKRHYVAEWEKDMNDSGARTDLDYAFGLVSITEPTWRKSRRHDEARRLVRRIRRIRAEIKKFDKSQKNLSNEPE